MQYFNHCVKNVKMSWPRSAQTCGWPKGPGWAMHQLCLPSSWLIAAGSGWLSPSALSSPFFSFSSVFWSSTVMSTSIFANWGSHVSSGKVLVVAGLLSSLAVFGLMSFSSSISVFCGFVQAEAVSFACLAATKISGNKMNNNEQYVCLQVKKMYTRELFKLMAYPPSLCGS